MVISRRSALRACGIAFCSGLAGCALSLPGGDEPPAVVSRHVTHEGGRCVDHGPTQQVTEASYDRDIRQVQFAGLLGTETPCQGLLLTDFTGVGRSEFRNTSIHINVDLGMLGDCEPCSTESTYSATATFDRHPSTIYLYHIGDVDGEWKRIGPLRELAVG